MSAEAVTEFVIRDFDRLPASGQILSTVETSPWLGDFRRRALDDLRRQGLPGVKTEDWKYTSVRNLVAETFATAVDLEANSASEIRTMAATATAGIDPDRCHLVVVVNGILDAELSSNEDLPDGLRLTSLQAAMAGPSPAVGKLLGTVVSHQRHPFAALNGALFENGVWLDIEPGVDVVKPLVLVWLTLGRQPALVQPRLLVRVGEGARLTLLEQHCGGRVGHLTNKVTEVSLSDNAGLTHLQLQQLRDDRLICGSHVRCGRDSRYRALDIDLGGKLVRNDLVVGLDEPGTEVEADGLFLVAGATQTTENEQAVRSEHIDNHVRIDHRAPRGRSRAYYKGLLARGGRGVFNGKLIVHPGAQKTDARQVNHNLLLSRDVEIDTKPELEIYADDVKCSHGCTTGALEPDQLFYLRSRGIDSHEANSMLVTAFARDITERIADPALRRIVESRLDPVLQQVTVNGEAK